MVSLVEQQNAPVSIGILLANTGTPEAPTPTALRHFLAEFLSDRRIVQLPRWLWLPILHLIILNTRPRRSAKLYQAIWNEHGSPLLQNSRSQADRLFQEMSTRINNPIEIQIGMRYGKPSIYTGLEALRTADVERLLILPLFPQYSQTTSASVADAVSFALKKMGWSPELRLIEAYYDHPAYIQALVQHIENYWKKHGKPQRLLFSFHGIPLSYTRQGDPYPDHCHTVSSLTAEALGLEKEMWQLSFQSRFGFGEWLKPYTDKTLLEFGRFGIHDVQIVAPGFSSDCLETLYELAIEAKEIFLEAGGKEFGYIPALNDQPSHIEALTDIISDHLDGWLTATQNNNE